MSETTGWGAYALFTEHSLRQLDVQPEGLVVVEDILDIRPVEYYNVLHTPQGISASLLMTFHLIPTESGGTHLMLALKAQTPFQAEWFNRLFCKIIVRIQLLKFWKMDTIDDLIKGNSVVE